MTEHSPLISTIVLVLVLRVVDPPISSMMVGRYLEAWGEGDWRFSLHQQWRDYDGIAASLPISVVAAEDQQFPLHHGFDLQAIEKARDHNARGSRRERMQCARTRACDFQVRLKAAVRIDLCRRKRQDLPLNDRSRRPSAVASGR